MDSPKSSPYVFHVKGSPLCYRSIQHHYAKALKKAGLYNRFSGTHFLRHSMASITRKVTGNLESVQAVTGHKDQKLVQHYAKLPQEELQSDAISKVENFLFKSND